MNNRRNDGKRTDIPSPDDLVEFLTQAQEARCTHPLTRRRLLARRQSDEQRSKRPWVGEPNDPKVDDAERDRAKERQSERNRLASEGNQFKADMADPVFGAQVSPTRPFNGGRRLLQLTPVPRSTQYKSNNRDMLDALLRLLAPELSGTNSPPCSEEEAREVIADFVGPRQYADLRQE